MLRKKSKYKQNNPNRDIKRLVILAIVVGLLAMLSSFVSHLDFSNSVEENNIDISNFTDMKSVLEFYNCEYISQVESTDNNYEIDVYAKLNTPLYNEDETSNENFYNRLIRLSASILQFKNFRIIDTENEITIEVICEENSIRKTIINGIEDYFAYMNSQISLKEYKEIPETEFLVDSTELNNLIRVNWSERFLNLDNSDGIFQNYNQYLEQGIQYRTINNKIYNIVFTNKYTNPVINGIIVREGFDTVENKLGEATFFDNELKIKGYKGKDFYVFFTENQISIYRRETVNYEDFILLANRLTNSELDLYDFMNELTYLWNDYSEYIVGEDYFYITYPTKGVSIKCNYENTNAIILYNNCSMTQADITKCLDLPEFLAYMQVDNVFEAEQNRVENLKSLVDKCESFRNERQTEENPLISAKYDFYADTDLNGNITRMYFIAKDENLSNKQLNEYMDTFAWLNDTIFIYSNPNEGIYYYNLENNQKGILMSGEDEFKIKSLNNNILKYDDKEIMINF